MYSHILVGSNDIARSKKFYDALFTAIGGEPGAEMRPGRIAYTHNGARFVVTVPNDGKPATAANGGTIGFPLTIEPQPVGGGGRASAVSPLQRWRGARGSFSGQNGG